jgi:hypothetical protein
MRKHLFLLASILSVGMWSSVGCVSKSKLKTNDPQAVEQPKNHGQERKEEVHERNEERKEAHDAEKAAKKDDKKP